MALLSWAHLGLLALATTQNVFPQVPINAPEKGRDSLPCSPAQAIKGLYAAFNERDADAAGTFLADNCVYEDLLLGPSTVCRGRKAFVDALRFHPAFLSTKLLDAFPFELPKLVLVVDSIAEGDNTVGVEWHVEVGGSPFPLGRGLSQAQVDPASGEIVRVVDIAEAPWRMVGILLLPFISIASYVFPTLYRVPEAREAPRGTSLAASERRKV